MKPLDATIKAIAGWAASPVVVAVRDEHSLGIGANLKWHPHRSVCM
jgi:hypothetical protein